MAAHVGDNKAQNRFELDVEGAVAFANYRLAPCVSHHHPYRDAASPARPRHRLGTGAGRAELIRADRLKVVAGCGFVVDYLRKHPEFADLVE